MTPIPLTPAQEQQAAVTISQAILTQLINLGIAKASADDFAQRWSSVASGWAAQLALAKRNGDAVAMDRLSEDLADLAAVETAQYYNERIVMQGDAEKVAIAVLQQAINVAMDAGVVALVAAL